MTCTWDAKNNFILLHFVNLYQQRSLTSNIDWSSIVNDIDLEIRSTPSVRLNFFLVLFPNIFYYQLLKTQYDHLLESFHSKQDS